MQVQQGGGRVWAQCEHNETRWSSPSGGTLKHPPMKTKKVALDRHIYIYIYIYIYMIIYVYVPLALSLSLSLSIYIYTHIHILIRDTGLD